MRHVSASGLSYPVMRAERSAAAGVRAPPERSAQAPPNGFEACRGRSSQGHEWNRR